MTPLVRVGILVGWMCLGFCPGENDFARYWFGWAVHEEVAHMATIRHLLKDNCITIEKRFWAVLKL
jgi:hypothetical protein